MTSSGYDQNSHAFVLADATSQQRRAADPRGCVWVGASAGTGKTKVLTDRVLNLLLTGTPPQKILCLTFTRAAAGEMLNRIMAQLGRWRVLEIEDLEKELSKLLGQAPSKDQRDCARSLFSNVLNAAGGGLKILTIHGFCQSLLKRFPLEARVQPHFSVIDPPEAQDLLALSQADILSCVGDKALQEDLSCLAAVIDYPGFMELLAYLVAERGRLRKFYGLSAEKQAAILQKALGLAGTLASEQEAVSQFCVLGAAQEESLKEGARCLLEGGKTDHNRGEVMLHWLSDAGLRQAGLEAYKSAFLTQSGEIRAKLVSVKVAEKFPFCVAVLQQEAQRCLELSQTLQQIKVYQITKALNKLLAQILAHYEDLKRTRSVLDYEDLIEKTASLLGSRDVSPWVLYKLDNGIDHILVDEAQDTNRTQWSVISALVEEFYTDASASQTGRTLFVVGDAKQSIYSFQGADPLVFDQMRQRFSDVMHKNKRPWWEIELQTSFRSTRAVLETVDAVFADSVMQEGVLFSEGQMKHRAFRHLAGGEVEVWPLVPQEKQDAPLPPWEKSVDRKFISGPQRLAQAIAHKIQNWLTSKEILASKGRPIQPEDILILVQKRGPFVEHFIRSCKSLGVPVTGADRLRLLDHIAVQDLMALARFLLLPEDDLSLACVLKSPLVGLAEEDLFELAWNREDLSLWERLKSASEERFRQAESFLSSLLSQAGYKAPYDFFHYILGPLNGRRLILSRLGEEALDPLEEFLSLALAYEEQHIPSLQGFIHWMQQGDFEIKRDFESLSQVRIMTVHGSKGLQAPIVFLPDTTTIPSWRNRVLWAEEEISSSRGQLTFPVWNASQAEAPPTLKALKGRQQEALLAESRRLLYVALTRAEDRLYIGGWSRRGSEESEDAQNWYRWICEGMRAMGTEKTFSFLSESSAEWSGTGWAHHCPQRAAIQSDQVEMKNNATPVRSLPTWLTGGCPEEVVKEKALNPSRLEQKEAVSSDERGESTIEQQRADLEVVEIPAQVRGTLIHSLLEYLPDIPFSQRRQWSRAYIRRTFPEMLVGEIESLIEEGISLVSAAHFSWLWGAGSRAEVPVAGIINGREIQGQIDRLVVTETAVKIIDYKSDRVVPTCVSQVPEPYTKQLSLYRDLLSKVYPATNIEGYILWTSKASLMKIL